jgi:hypothetical protein
MGDLVRRLQNMFRRLDTDNSGGLSHQVSFTPKVHTLHIPICSYTEVPFTL